LSERAVNNFFGNPRASRRWLGLAAVVASLSILSGCAASSAAGDTDGGASDLATRSATGQEAWVANYALESDPGDTITPVDLISHRTDPTVTTASEPAALAITANGRSLLVANRGKDTLSVIDTVTGAVTHTITVGLEPDAVAVAPGGTNGHGIALVANFGDDTVTAVDLGTMKAKTPVHVGNEPDAIAIAPGNSAASATALVANFASGTITPIDLSTMQAEPAVSVGREPDAVAVVPGDAWAGSPDTATAALVANFGDSTLSPIDLSTMQAGPQIAVGGNPTGIAMAPDHVAWVVGGMSLTPVAPVLATPGTFTPGTPLALPRPGEAVSLEGTGTAWVALQGGSLAPVALATGQVGRSVQVGGRPSAVAIWSP
jgi:YVTN family beta-propeller protein